MLRRVDRERVRIGMYVDSFEGSWFDHPFWRSSFLLTDAADVRRIRESRVAGIIIDLDRGAGPDDRRSPSPEIQSPGAPQRRRTDPPPEARPFAAYRPHDEKAVVPEILKRSKRAIRALFADVRLGRTVTAVSVMPLIDELTGSIERDPAALIGLTRIKSKNEYTFLHSIAVAGLMINFSRHLGLDEDMVRLMGVGGLLHDIGKIAVPADVLEKPEALTDAEMAIMRSHPGKGHELLLRDGEMPSVVLDVCLHHHERIDGTGYPQRLSGDAVSLPARIAAICDVYDAITSNRPYKRAWTPAEALARMTEWHGHFDRDLLYRFIDSIGIHPLGALVRLRTNRLGLVLRTTSNPHAPVVRAFYATRDPDFLDPVDIAISEGFTGDQIVGIEDPAAWFTGDWKTLAEAVTSRRPVAELRAIATPLAMTG